MFKGLIYLFLERGGERKREKLPLVYPQVGTWPLTQAHGNRTNDLSSDLSVHRPALSPLNHMSQDTS